MVGKQHSSDYRLSAITHYEKSGSFTDTCRVFDCKRQTLKRWYNTYKSSKLLTRKNRKEGVVGWKLYEEGAVNSERLTDFIAYHITANYEGKLVIMDNAGFHKTHDVKQEIQKRNEFLYSIPYYPRSNPIENFFSKLKYYIKKKSPLTYQQIHTTIEDAIKDMKEKEFKNYFLYAFDKEAVKKIYKRNSTLKREGKVYI